MKVRPTTRLEWEVKDESNAIVTAQPPQRDALHYHASKRSRRWSLIVFAVALLLLASSIGVARLVAQAERNIAQAESEVEMAVEADSVQQDPSAPKPQLQAIELQNDLAIVQMAGDDEPLYYRQSAEGWERIEPNEPKRGQYRHQETDHLLFQYYQVDQNLVEAVMPAIEAFTSDLYRDTGLDLSPARAKVTLRIAIVAATQRVEPLELVGYVTWESDGIVVLSPQFSHAASTNASADVLKQAISANVAHQLILRAVEEYQPQAVWRPLLDGLQLWAYSAHREFDFDLANNTNKLDNLLRRRLATEMPLRLPLLAENLAPLGPSLEAPETSWQQLALSKTIIDYAIATYGRHSLARLLKGMHQYDSWQSLIPAVFELSMEEFESGWQDYLAERYNLYP